jgi:glycerol-3-phosphate dehydrogenase (NAD(P)+)
MTMDKIAIIGSGAWGTALASLYTNQENITVLARSADSLKNSNSNIKFTSNMNDILDHDLVLLVTPAQTIRSFCHSAVKKLKKDAVICICSKGIEQETGYLMSEIVQEILPSNRVAILSGPNFANEISQGLPAISSLACDDIVIANFLADKLSTYNFKLYPNSDIIGTQLYGALKNVLAIMCGISIGFNLGENAKAALITKGIKEIVQIIRAKKADLKTIFEPAGAGDLFLTCNSTQSRNTSLGIEIVKFGSFNKSLLRHHVEGVYTTNGLSKMIRSLNLTLPIFDLTCKIINDQIKVKKENIIKLVL